MALRNTPGAFGAVAVALHWIIAVAILAMIYIGYRMVETEDYDLFALHKSLGKRFTLRKNSRMLPCLQLFCVPQSGGNDNALLLAAQRHGDGSGGYAGMCCDVYLLHQTIHLCANGECGKLCLRKRKAIGALLFTQGLRGL